MVWTNQIRGILAKKGGQILNPNKCMQSLVKRFCFSIFMIPIISSLVIDYDKKERDSDDFVDLYLFKRLVNN